MQKRTELYSNFCHKGFSIGAGAGELGEGEDKAAMQFGRRFEGRASSFRGEIHRITRTERDFMRALFLKQNRGESFESTGINQSDSFCDSDQKPPLPLTATIGDERWKRKGHTGRSPTHLFWSLARCQCNLQLSPAFPSTAEDGEEERSLFCCRADRVCN